MVVHLVHNHQSTTYTRRLTELVHLVHIGFMQLSEYLKSTGQSIHGFAVKHGLVPSTVNRLANGKTFPSVDVLDVIVAATNGVVTANDFHEAVKGRAA